MVDLINQFVQSEENEILYYYTIITFCYTKQ